MLRVFKAGGGGGDEEEPQPRSEVYQNATCLLGVPELALFQDMPESHKALCYTMSFTATLRNH